MTAGDPYGSRAPMGPPEPPSPPDTPIPDSEYAEVLSIKVIRKKMHAGDSNTDQFDGISSWHIDERDRLFVIRGGIEVKVYAPGQWYSIECNVTFRDGHKVGPSGMTSAPTDVGLGVQVTAVGGRMQ